MKVVRIIKDWKGPATLLRQTPNNDGIWNGVRFTFDEVDTCDYVVVWNRPPFDIQINCLEGGKWLIAGEPPSELHAPYLEYYKYFDKVFTQFPKSEAKEHIITNGALPWHVKKNYQELATLGSGRGEKKNMVSCISSSLSFMEGHKKRQRFIKYLKDSGYYFDLYGRGINPVDDKFDALFPYKYSIAIENSSYPHYWTEKIADCFLSWSMPVYYGCLNIANYFPVESMILIDITKPEEALAKIKQAVAEDWWLKNLDAIAEARKLVLEKYQFFPKMVNWINQERHKDRKKVSSFIPYSAGFWEHNHTLSEKFFSKIRQVGDFFKR